MISAPLPYVLEDRSGVYNASDFDDIYDRLFLRIVESSHDAKTSVSMIYDMGRRSSRRRDSRHLDRQPSVVLQFGSNGALGNVHFMRSPAASSLPMHQYLLSALSVRYPDDSKGRMDGNIGGVIEASKDKSGLASPTKTTSSQITPSSLQVFPRSMSLGIH